jgi:hypothetical protein
MRTVGKVGALVCGLLVSVLTATGARADTLAASGDRPTAERHCRVVLDRLQAGEQFSRVLSRTCADRPEGLHINAGTLLITWYEHADFGGASTYVEGQYGPCDREGYGIRDVGWLWENNISSYKLWNNCYHARLYTALNYGGSAHLKDGTVINYVGNELNDNIRSLQIWSQ